MKAIVLKVEGMSCMHCVRSVEGALKSLGASGKVDLKEGTVEAEFDEAKTGLEAIRHAIEEAGYTVKGEV